MRLDDRISASAAAIRRAVLDASRRANRGHIGSALSVADLVAGIVHVFDLGGRPRATVARTKLGRGVSFMEAGWSGTTGR